MVRVLSILSVLAMSLPVISCSGSAVSVSDLCEKMLECGSDREMTLADCEKEMQALSAVIRRSSWNALANCYLNMTCEEFNQEDAYQTCLEAAANAAPAGVGDPFLSTYCQRSVDCGQYPGSVEECLALTKQQAGDYLGWFNMLSDGLIACFEDCVGDLSCTDLNDFFEVCGLACDVPFVEVDLDCDHGQQEEDLCVCDQGWAGELCDECAPGYIPDGWNCVAACQPDSCSGHGICDDSYGYLNCSCDTGYAGEHCEICAAGYFEVEDRCRPESGCVNDGDACDDGLLCTSADSCSQGFCVGVELDCDDGLACTLDSCLELHGGCYHDPQPSGEPEGDLGDPICDNGLDDDCDGLTDLADPDCLVLHCGTPADCPDDENPCTETICPDGLCAWAPVPDATPCPGSNACSSSFICRQGECLPDFPDRDQDQDGFADDQCPHGTDCDDSNPAIHPGAEGPEGDATCLDAVDNDCDGLTDQLDQSCWPMECSPEGWCLEYPRTGSSNLTGLWTPAFNDVWISGGEARFLHWDGSAFFREESPSNWAVYDMCGCAPDDGWAAGQTGDVLHYTGESWQQFLAPHEPHILYGIWCNCQTVPMTEAWAVGRPGVIMYYDGIEWTLESYSTFSDLYDVWAAGTGEAWAVGRNGSMVHYLDSAWQVVDSGTTDDLQSIWGRSASEIWVVGENGTILYYDGSGWTPQSYATSGDLNHVWGLSGLGPYAVGGLVGIGLVLEYAGDGWQESDVFGDSPQELLAVGGTSADDLWAVGARGAIVRADSQGAIQLTAQVGLLTGICALEAQDNSVRAWALGRSMDRMLEWNGTDWQVNHTAWEGSIETSWCSQEHGIWLMDQYGAYLRFGAFWHETGEIGELPTADYIKALAGRVHDDEVELWAVGDDGLAAHFDGSTWVQENVGTGWNELRDVWVAPQPSILDVVAVGERGALATRDRLNGWTLHEDITAEDLNAVWGDGLGTIWVVGENGTVLRWDGANFVPQILPFEVGGLEDVGGTGPLDVWIISWDQVLRYDGFDWTSEPIASNHNRKLTVTPSHAWVADFQGEIYHKIREP